MRGTMFFVFCLGILFGFLINLAIHGFVLVTDHYDVPPILAACLMLIAFLLFGIPAYFIFFDS